MRDNYKTEVIFRVEAEGTILAVFPYDIADYKGNCTCYARIGQHSALNWEYLRNTRPAKANEYNSLFEELESLGYNLKVIKRRSYKKYLTEFNKVR